LQLPFGVTLLTGLVILALLALWAVHRSRVPGNRDVGAGWTAGTAFALLFVLVVAACELQPLILDDRFHEIDHIGGSPAVPHATMTSGSIRSCRHMIRTMEADD
jgi:hypothetical protein